MARTAVGTRIHEQVIDHGQRLCSLFDVKSDPEQLCKALRRIERKAAAYALAQCNGTVNISFDSPEHDAKIKGYLDAVDKLLNFRAQGIPVFVNLDPRGHALKIDDDYMRTARVWELFGLTSDWGGYGIIAPEFTGKD
jgi:hypothetical protein